MTKLIPNQCRNARLLLNLSQGDLATLAGIDAGVVRDFELDKPIDADDLQKIVDVIEATGIVIPDDPATELRRNRRL